MVPERSKETILTSESEAAARYYRLMFVDADDRLRRLRGIETIAEEMQRSVAEVAPIYEEVLDHLMLRARIQDYLLIITSKNVKKIIKRLLKKMQAKRDLM